MPAYAIIPLSATRKDTFTYEGPAGIQRGQLVRIPLGPRQIEGIVAGPASTVPQVKTLTVTNGSVPPLMLELVEWAAKTYLTPAGVAARLLLPSWLKPQPTAQLSQNTDRSVTRTALKPRLLIGNRRAAEYLKALRDTEHFLVLVPEIAMAESLSELERTTGAVRFHSGLTAAKRQEIWQGVASGRITKVIGTRGALWLPWKDLQAVIVDEEDDRSYKADRAPRYHARSVASKLAGLYGAQLWLASAAPSLESWHHAVTRSWSLMIIPEAFPELVTTPVGSAQEPLTATSLEALPGHRTLIWTPQASWKQITQAITAHSPELAIMGPGSAFGSRLQVNQFRAQTEAVMVGSTALTHPWDFQADQVIVLGIDGLLQQPDFRAGERVHAILRKLAGQATQRLLIQTEHADYPAISRLGRDPATFYTDELSERKLLNLPPFRRLSRLEFKKPTDTVLAEAQRLLKEAGLAIRPLPEVAEPTLLAMGDPSVIPRPLPSGWVMDVDTQRAT